MLAKGDSIDDTAILRAGAAGELSDVTRAPSTIGSWLLAHKWSNVRQLDAVSRELLARLWSAGAGPAVLAGPLMIDLDSSIVEVYGRAKQGAAFGYTKVRGYHPQLATRASTGMVLFSRLRGGSAGAARGAKSFLTETVSRVRDAGSTRQLTIRADSAFYSRAVLGAAVKLGVDFSVTARQDKKIRVVFNVPGDWSPADADDIYDYPPPGPGPQRSPRLSPRSRRSRSAADQRPRPHDQDFGEAGRPAGSARPGLLEAMLTQSPSPATAHSRPCGSGLSGLTPETLL